MTDSVTATINAIIYMMLAVIVFKGAVDVALNMLLFLVLINILLAINLRHQ